MTRDPTTGRFSTPAQVMGRLNAYWDRRERVLDAAVRRALRAYVNRDLVIEGWSLGTVHPNSVAFIRACFQAEARLAADTNRA